MKLKHLAAACSGALLLTASAVRAEGDYSTPKAAAKSFVSAIAKGDAAGAQEAIVPNEKHVPIVEALAKLTGAQKKLGEAAVKAFGDAGKELGGGTEEGGDRDPVKQIDAADVKEEGDTATLIGKENPEPLTLKKIDGKWKIDLASMPNAAEMESSMPMLSGMAELMEATTAEIEAGKYKSVDEAKQAISMKLMAKMMEQNKPATAPTTGPSDMGALEAVPADKTPVDKAPATDAPATDAPATKPM